MEPPKTTNQTKLPPKAQTQVEGQRIERIYEQYSEGYYHVNRRYQRKLVWTLAQKQSLIDSILNNIPIPLILLAKSDRIDGSFEIIDGLQRINAIVSFLENSYTYSGDYFNLESLGLTKYLRDQGSLTQNHPVMSREESLQVAQYMLPVSIYRAAASSLVDETFRRINSSGRQLGMQEVRQAGSTSQISDIVRKISADIRGDVSRADYISLDEMSKLSLRWKEDPGSEGVPVENIFWITERVLRRDDLRSSRDEQLVLDLLIDILVGEKFDTSSEVRDAVYDETSDVGRAVATSLSQMPEPDSLVVQFSAILDLMTQVAEAAGKTWTQHTGKSTNNPTARYFHIAFRAIYSLMYEKNLEVTDFKRIVESTENYWHRQTLDLGGTWKAGSRSAQVRKFKGAIQDCFSESSSPEVAVRREDIERLKRDFLRFASEHRFYELKQGFTDLSPHKTFATNLASRREFVEGLIKTCTAMSNTTPGASGVIYIGISDRAETTAAIKSAHSISPLALGDAAVGLPNYIMGIDHELSEMRIDLDTLLETLKNWILTTRSLAESVTEYRKQLIAGIRPVRIASSSGESRIVVAIYADPVTAPVQYKGKYWERIGSSNHEFQVEEREIEDPFDRYEEFKYRWS